MARNGCEGCAQDEGYSARSRGGLLYSDWAGLFTAVRGTSLLVLLSWGSGSKPQIHTSHKSDVLVWVPAGLVLVATPGIKNVTVHQYNYYLN